MSRNYGGPRLPKTLLDQVQTGRVGKKKDISRKDRRREERLSKKSARARSHAPSKRPIQRPHRTIDEDAHQNEDDSSSPPAQAVAKHAKQENSDPAKTIVANGTAKHADERDEEASLDGSDASHSETESPAPHVSRGVKSRLEDDDAEIAALEKKLGMKKGKKKSGDDELDWLVYGSGSEDDSQPSKRKRPEDDDWLRSKRRKAEKAPTRSIIQENELSDGEDMVDVEVESDKSDDAAEDLQNPFSDDELSEDDFEGFEDEDVTSRTAPVSTSAPRKRENPYIAPVASSPSPAKYVPPSLRPAPSGDEEVLKQLRRHVQGLLNRLSESNLLSILQSVQDIYAKNARQHVTSTLVELLRGLICDPSILNETFLILHAGFAAAIYRVVGTDFGAQLLESIVEEFDRYHYRQNTATADEHPGVYGKQTLNLLGFLSNLYTLQAISSDIIFDYVRMLLDKDNFSEANTELLLRVIRNSGQQLRQDDPSALKDIVLLLQRTVSSLGEFNVSVRTKFMIETIHNLKNNRMKTGVTASALSAEHMQRMKKMLGSIKSAKTTEPLRITLADIRDSGKKGKWWLVGASWRDPARMANSQTATSTAVDGSEDRADVGADSDSSQTPDLDRLARSQGMNTDVRRAIFIAVTGAVDYQHAYQRIQKLSLKNKQQLEIPRVLIHCVTAEPVYNHFYTLVATQFCGDHKLRKAWQFALLDVFRRLGEGREDDDSDDAQDGESFDVRRVYNLARVYATLIADGLLRLTMLKSLDFSQLQAKTNIFCETFFTTVFVSLRKKANAKPKSERNALFEKGVRETFAAVHSVPEMVNGLKYYITTVVANTDLAGTKKEARVIEDGCDLAIEALTDQNAGNMPVMDDSEDD